jgi:hypothetical protein
MKSQKVATNSEKEGLEQQARGAVEEMGATNWIGRLLGKLLLTLLPGCWD